eukprot:7158053-Ditylum_brightwellii.AAC.1
MHTAPIIHQVLYYKVAQWCQMPKITQSRIPPDSTGNYLRNAVDMQLDMGWSNFMKGQVSHHWCQAQVEYCKSFPRPKQFNSHTWSIKLIKAI